MTHDSGLHPPLHRRRIIATAAATAFVLAILAVPATAPAAVTITTYKVTSDLPAAGTPADGPSTLQAGANSNAGTFSAFSYPNAAEDVQTAITHFAAGLLGNPESVAKCSEATLQAGGTACPAASEIGTSRLDTNAFGSFAGKVYNAELLGNEPGRLGIVTNAGPLGTLVSSIPFTITPRGATDYGLTGTLSNITQLPGPVQVTGLSFLLNGATNAYVRNPTSCMSQTSTGQANGYVDATFVEGPAYTFTTTGCSQVPFRPAISVQIGDKGTTRQNGYPPVVIKITQPNGDADQKANKITLPPELNTNNSAYKLCTESQADSDTCPANSKFGNVSAKSPFLGAPLGGPVYLLQQSGSSLPGLLLDLQGRAHVKIKTRTQLVNNRIIQSLASNAPQLPISELTIGLNGGKTTGVFQNREDLCFRGSSSSRVNVVSGFAKFEGWNGAVTPDTKIQADVNGCGPGVTGNLSRVTGSEPSLTVKADKHPDAPSFKELTVTLSRNLSLVRSKLDEASGSASAVLGGGSFDYVNRRSFKVTGLPSGGASKATLRLRDGAIKISKRSRDLLRRGRSRRFSVKVTQTPVTGNPTSTRDTFTEKGPK